MRLRATKLGAFQFLEKPLTPEAVLVALRSALELGRTLAENTRLQSSWGTPIRWLGRAPRWRSCAR